MNFVDFFFVFVFFVKAAFSQLTAPSVFFFFSDALNSVTKKKINLTFTFKQIQILTETARLTTQLR